MSEQQMKLEPRHANQFACLLRNFSIETACVILKRFDRATRNRVRSRMDELSSHGIQADESLLEEFADFLKTPSAIPEPEIKTPHHDRTGHRSNTRYTIHDILEFNDESLDSLLKAAPAEMTISVLSCTPQTFIDRVLDRLSPDDEKFVRKRIDVPQAVDFSEMKSIHRQYCEFASRLVDQGLIRP